jgi:hypothetical protein
MFNQELYASAFARAVRLMQAGPSERAEQEASARALVSLSDLSAASFRRYEGGLSVDDVAIPSNVPLVEVLITSMEAHRVAELMIGRRSAPAEILAMLSGLAAEPGAGPSIKERLRRVASKRIMVILESAEDAPPELDLQAAFELLDGIASPGEAPSAPAALVPPTSAPGARTPAAPPPAPPAGSPLDSALAALVLDPYGAKLKERLAALQNEVSAVLRGDEAEVALRAMAIMVDLEAGAPEGIPRNHYGIVLQRLLTRDVLAHVAPCLMTPALAEAAAKVMRRMRTASEELLLGLLSAASELRERRVFLAVLVSMPGAAERVIAQLDHHELPVIRNIAEVLGDQRVVQAVPELVRVLGHYDASLREIAAAALARIGTPATVEPLTRALKEGSPALRARIAASLGGAGAGAFAMPLASLAVAETDPQLQKEFYAALGRIGTMDAIQALATAAAPGGKLRNRKSVAGRIAAIEGLRIAGAVPVLATLAADADKAVRAAAQGALKQQPTRTGGRASGAEYGSG